MITSVQPDEADEMWELVRGVGEGEGVTGCLLVDLGASRHTC